MAAGGAIGSPELLAGKLSDAAEGSWDGRMASRRSAHSDDAWLARGMRCLDGSCTERTR